MLSPREPLHIDVPSRNDLAMKFDYDVCVVGGCGHVGLPLAITFSQCGLRVCIHDIDGATVKQVQAGTMPFLEPGADQALRDALKCGLHVDNDPGLQSKAQYVI